MIASVIKRIVALFKKKRSSLGDKQWEEILNRTRERYLKLSISSEKLFDDEEN